MNILYADIIIGISHEQLDKTFQYSVPDDLRNDVSLGAAVLVPFGSGNKQVAGYVVGLGYEAKIDPEKIKDISGITSDSELPETRMIALAGWLKSYYGGTMSQALKTVLPVRDKVRMKETKILRLVEDRELVEGYLERMRKKKASARVRLLEALIDVNTASLSSLKEKLNVSGKTVTDLETAGVITVEVKELYRNPVVCSKKNKEKLILNRHQEAVVRKIRDDIDRGIKKTYLLHGITGSGKTLCYIELIDHIVDQGKQAIVLIPEIALTFQTVQRFYNRFGDRVSILNSRMSKGERYDQFLRAARGDIDVIIGPRSALFTPFKNIGLIVIDEEHEESYKSETTPKYHARETAIHIAEGAGASVILGSATPSVDSFYKACSGEYELLVIKERAAARSLPDVHIEDMREELSAGNRQMFSRGLMASIQDRLNKSEQAMLFINKRGFAGFISCRSCGHVMKCPHCDVSLTYHRNGKLICHYCGHEEPMVKTCPECGSGYIAGFRAGTQQVEEKIKELFPEARVLRMDKDTTTGKDGHAKILERFANHEADILIGTQMIVKGHDFSDVTLVAALAADMSLYSNDYRAGERTFQLLTQAAGRAGRGEKKGEVYIQTYSPDNFCVVESAKQDYDAFYKEEIEYRRGLLYPPIWNMMTVTFASKDEAVLIKAIEAISSLSYMHAWEADHEGRVQVIGPARDVIYKLDDEYRMILYIKAQNDDDLTELKNMLEDYIRKSDLFIKVFTQFDRT